MSIHTDIQALAVDALVELFVIDATSLGGSVYPFHAGTNQLKGSVVWAGVTYPPMAIAADGFELSGKGKLPRPTLHCQNTDGLIGALADTYDDLIGAKVTRKRTLAKYLDAVNFPGGVNPTADPSAAFPDDVFFINRKSRHDKTLIEFELAAASDVHGVRLPRRQIVQHICTFHYRDADSGCPYAGGAVAKADDTPTTILGEDDCGKRIRSCELRFGAHAPLPWGGFAGAGVVSG